MSIGNFLFLRLRQMGIAHVFGVPGDFNLQLLEQLQPAEGIEFVGACNELNAAYAADGYARLNGVGALLTTYGVGDLSAVCGIAGSCAEHVPVVFISGTPPLYAMESRLRLHHSLAEGNFDNVRNCVEEFTAAYARITPSNAVEEIDRVLKTCWREKLPVFLQVPSNISYLEVDVPETALRLTLPESDPERLESAVARIAALLAKAERPALLVDMDADRSALALPLATLVRKRQIPYAAYRSGKAILSESDPLYVGVYNGKASAKDVTEVIGNSDCLIATAPCYTEGSPMIAGIPVASHVYIRGFSVAIEDEVYEGVTASQLVERLLEVVEVRPVLSLAAKAQAALPAAQSGAALTHARLWPCMEAFFRAGDVVIAENGTSALAMSDVRLPEGCTYIAQPIWGSIGFTLPALLGSLTAASHRRQILFIGDGSLQLTVQELSTILHRGLKPIIFVLNNRGYTIERYILGRNAAYNDIAGWSYLNLPRVFAPEVKVNTVSVRTEDELEAALQNAEQADCLSFIELSLDPHDAPQLLKVFGPVVAEMDYGPRGPQRKN
ncbi:alpha-keto acid decarboxylase family protein [Telmatobacter bradus]|uniref:alpha-keto acid decarboxylase family protein n=1 Tax=Telmatobacter bradus TaxID=474953 RepID=UPI003B43B470